jgi:hypothetical protein
VLNKLEGSRPLNTPEKCFRDILKNHILNLLQHQKDYWKKRYTVRWTKLGDESTNFFHAAATERYRLNTITSLDDDDGRTITNHDKKVALLWEEYKNMLGCTQNTQMHFNMIDLLQTQNLDHITEPFTKVQIDAVVANMPLDKAPWPDGFNGKFIKKCWGIIKEDIYKLCLDFFDGAVDLQAINNSFITLVPKVNNPTTVNDFRLISLINCVVKIITKLLGDRLQKVIISLVHQN